MPDHEVKKLALSRLGLVLKGKYRLERVLGIGGMAVVYAATHRNKKRVAIKMLHPELSFGEGIRTRFLREGYLANSVEHPGAVAVLDDDVAEDGSAFVVMDYLEGVPVDRLPAQSGGRVPLRLVVSIGEALLDVLAAAHAKGVVHRDIKPANLFLTNDGRLMVLDFGIARLRDATSSPESETQSGAMMGTPAFMAPEQALGESSEVGEPTDLWAVGATLFTLLTGELIHAGTSPLHVLMAAGTRPARSLRTVAPEMPDAIAEVIDKALAFNKSERWQRAGEMREHLATAYVNATGESVAALPKTERPPEPEVTIPSQQELVHGGNGVGGRDAAAAPVATGEAVSKPSDVPSPDAPVGVWRRRTTAWLAVAAVSIIAAATLATRSRAPQPTAAAGSSTSPTDGCTSNAQCVDDHHGEAWKCSSARKRCLPLTSPACSVLATNDDLRADDTVWFGALLPTTGAAAEDIAPERNAIDLARRDFSETLAGSFSRAGALRARRIGVVLCDESRDPESSAHHLVEDVEVPAVIGFRWSKTALDTIPSVFLPAHVLSFVSVSQAPSLTEIPQTEGEPRLVWRSTLSLLDAFRPLSAIVSDLLEPKLRSSGLGRRPMRVAFVRAIDRARQPTRDFGDELLRELRFNGKGAVDNRDNFRQYPFDEGEDSRSVVKALADFAPHVIIFEGNTFPRDVLVPLESAWKTPQRPFYVSPSDLPEGVASFAGRDPRRRARFLGITNLTTTATNANLALHYNFAFPGGEPIARTEAPQPSYDAFYTLAYAAEAIGPGAVTGIGLSSAIDRLLPPGKRVEVGPSGILDGFKVLRSNGGIDLVGAIGSLDFDRATGEAPIDYAVLCLGVDDRGNAHGSVESGLVFVAHDRRLTGTFDCP